MLMHLGIEFELNVGTCMHLILGIAIHPAVSFICCNGVYYFILLDVEKVY